jgi:hypothetical protein
MHLLGSSPNGATAGCLLPVISGAKLILVNYKYRLVDKCALAGNSPDDILGGQYPRHFAATPTGISASDAIFSVN